MGADTDRPAGHAAGDRGSAALWYALFGAPVAWFISLSLAYFAVTAGCRAGSELPLHLISLAGIAVGIGAGLTARLLWRGAGGGLPDENGDRIGRTRFIAAAAGALSALFTLVMIGQWLGVIIQDPCAPLPRLPDSPDAWVDDPAHTIHAAAPWIGPDARHRTLADSPLPPYSQQSRSNPATGRSSWHQGSSSASWKSS